MSPVAIVPTIGRVVLYCLSQEDADAINRRRTTGVEILERIRLGQWPAGAQAHIGGQVAAGDVLPGLVVRVWSEDMINIKVELDGTDQLWVTSKSVSDGPEPGKFHWMPYQLGQERKKIAIYKSSVDGLIVSAEYAEANPDTTYKTLV